MFGSPRDARRRRRDHDAAATTRPHRGNDGADADDHGANVDIDRPVELIERQPEQIAAHRDAGVEHGDVETTERVERRVDRSGVRRGIGDVADDRDRSSRRGPRPSRSARGRPATTEVPDADETLGGRSTDSRRRTGDDGDSVAHGFM